MDKSWKETKKKDEEDEAVDEEKEEEEGDGRRHGDEPSNGHTIPPGKRLRFGLLL